MLKTPDQELYDVTYKKIARELQYTMYPTLPPADTPYPFVVIGDTQIIPVATKSMLLGRGVIAVDVWGAEDNRKQVSDMTQDIFNMLMGGYSPDRDGVAYLWRVKPNDSDLSVRAYVDERDRLWRGTVNVEFNFY